MLKVSKGCCVCYDYNLDKLIYESKVALEKLSDNIIKQLCYGYSCDKKAEDKSKTLKKYLDILEDENRKINLGGKGCLDCNNMQSLAEKVRGLTSTCDIECRKDLVLRTKEEEKNKWITENPYCVSRERWEKLSYAICDMFDFDIDIIETTKDCSLDLNVMSVSEVCDLTFEIVRKLIPCDIIVAISTYQKMCDLDFKINRTLKECDLDFKILSEEVECDLDIKSYRRLIECNLSFNIIKTIYENGCSISVGDKIELVTPMNRYIIDKLSFKNIPSEEDIKRLGLDIEGSSFYKDSKSFLNSLEQDYSK